MLLFNYKVLKVPVYDNHVRQEFQEERKESETSNYGLQLNALMVDDHQRTAKFIVATGPLVLSEQQNRISVLLETFEPTGLTYAVFIKTTHVCSDHSEKQRILQKD